MIQPQFGPFSDSFQVEANLKRQAAAQAASASVPASSSDSDSLSSPLILPPQGGKPVDLSLDEKQAVQNQYLKIFLGVPIPQKSIAHAQALLAILSFRR